MTYTPDVPLPTDLPSDSQQTFRTNFNQLNTIFTENHFAFNDPTASLRGKHNWVTFPVRAADPPGLGATEIGLFCENLTLGDGTTPTELVMKRGGGSRIYLTGPEPSAVANGYTFLPGKLLIQWGKDTAASGDTAHSFNINFTGNAYSVVVTVDHNSSTATSFNLSATPSNSGFRIRNGDSSGHTFYWIAIGHQ